MSDRPDDAWLVALGTDVSDGKSVDWDLADRRATDEEARTLVSNLKRLEKVILAHRTADSGPAASGSGSEPAATAHWHHLVLFEVPLNAPGTPFQERVWNELCRIPFGELRSYEQIAVGIGSPKAVRAVGRANGMNRIAIVIPCHRVVGKDGTPTGYGGGIWRKQRLLDLERGAGLIFPA